MAHKWAKWLRHPCRLGDPHRCRAGGGDQKWPTSGQSGYVTPAVSGIPTTSERGKIRSGPIVGKVATSLLVSRGSPPLQSGGENQKWPTCGQSAYVTPAVSGIPTAAERGGKSEVAHKWAKWLRHPCRLGDPHHFRAGGKMRSGPLVGKVATSPLPSRGSPPLQSGGQNHKWPTYGQSGYVTRAVSGIPTAAKRGGGGSEVAHKWAKWLRHPCRLGDCHRFRAGEKSEVAHLWAKWLRHPCRLGDPHRCRAGEKSQVAHLCAKWLRHPCRLWDPHRFRAGGGNQKWATCGQSGYVTPAVSGIPTAAERGGNQKWPTCGQSGYVTPAVSGIPTAAERGGEITLGPLVGTVATSPLPSRGSRPLQSGGKIRSRPLVSKVATSPLPSPGSPPLHSGGGKSEVDHLWAKWLRHSCRLGDPHCCRARGKIRSGPQVGKMATSPLPSRGSPPLQSGGENEKWPTDGQSGYVTPAVSGIPLLQSRGGNQKWPTCGQSGYVTPAVSGIATAAQRGAISKVAHLWAKWLRHPCRLGDPHRCRARGKIRSGPQVGKMATSPLPSRGSHHFRAGGKVRSGPLVGKVATSPLSSRGSPPLQSGGGGIRSGPQVGKVATSPVSSRGSPPLQSGGGGDQKWPTSGQSGYVTPAVSGIPTASEWGKNQKRPNCGQSGYVTPAVSGIPTAAERGAKSQVAHLWAKWLRHPCRLGDPHRCKARGGGIRSGPQVGKVATSPLPPRGLPPLQSGGKIRSGPLVGKVATSPLPSRGSPPLQSGGKITSGPLVCKVATSPLPSRGSPPLQSGGGKSEVGHLWAKWLCHPCRLGDPHRCRAGREIRSGPLVGKVATSPLPSRGSPLLQSGGGKSHLAHLWAQWLRHPCRLGDPDRFRAGGKSEVAHL